MLGVGNLGRLFASGLAKLQPKPPPITLILHRKELLEQWVASPGLEIFRHEQVEKFLDFDVEWWTEERPSIGPVVEVTTDASIANLVVATKASDALPQVDRLRRYLDGKSTVVFTQNGMCNLWPPVGEIYNDHRFPDCSSPNWLACVTTHGVVNLGPFRSRHASVAGATVGPVLLNAQHGDRSQYLIRQLVCSPDLFAKEITRPELWVLQLEKLVINSIINPLTAILRCKNGELFAPPDDDLHRIIDLLIQQASEVLRALIQHPSSAEIIGKIDERLLSPQQRSAHMTCTIEELLDRLTLPRLHQTVHEVGFKVRENTSSMLQDVQAGKQTEIRSFNGWLIDTARLVDGDIVLDAHERLVHLVEGGSKLSKRELADAFSDIH